MMMIRRYALGQPVYREVRHKTHANATKFKMADGRSTKHFDSSYKHRRFNCSFFSAPRSHPRHCYSLQVIARRPALQVQPLPRPTRLMQLASLARSAQSAPRSALRRPASRRCFAVASAAASPSQAARRDSRAAGSLVAALALSAALACPVFAAVDEVRCGGPCSWGFRASWHSCILLLYLKAERIFLSGVNLRMLWIMLLTCSLSTNGRLQGVQLLQSQCLAMILGLFFFFVLRRAQRITIQGLSLLWNASTQHSRDDARTP